MVVKGVFFDLGGTLLIYGDMSAAWSDWFTQFYLCLKSYGLALSEESFAHSCDRFFSREEPTGPEDGLTIFERRIRALCAQLELSIEVAEIRHTANTIVNAWQKHLFLDPECTPVLEVLQRHKTLGLISNFDHPPHVRAVVRDLGLEKFFTAVVISGDVGIKKPDPRIYHLALERTGLQSDEVIYVGDTEEDVVGSILAGITPVLIQREPGKAELQSLDFRTDSSTLTPSTTADMADVRRIGSLPELIDIIE